MTFLQPFFCSKIPKNQIFIIFRSELGLGVRSELSVFIFFHHPWHFAPGGVIFNFFENFSGEKPARHEFWPYFHPVSEINVNNCCTSLPREGDGDGFFLPKPFSVALLAGADHWTIGNQANWKSKAQRHHQKGMSLVPCRDVVLTTLPSGSLSQHGAHFLLLFTFVADTTRQYGAARPGPTRSGCPS